jgi:hypothetical protein
MYSKFQGYTNNLRAFACDGQGPQDPGHCPTSNERAGGSVHPPAHMNCQVDIVYYGCTTRL